jgi:hypothetical protein
MRLLPVGADHGRGQLLSQKRNPTDTDISETITNICRCGTYQRIREGDPHGFGADGSVRRQGIGGTVMNQMSSLGSLETVAPWEAVAS